MAKKQLDNELSCRLNKVGGQAVLEGVMMKAGERTVTTCRKADGSLVVTDDSFKSIRKKHKFLNLPILRGVINFVEMMILSFKTLVHLPMLSVLRRKSRLNSKNGWQRGLELVSPTLLW